MVKPPKLTMAQVYTLRRIANGTEYVMNGNGKHADEHRRDPGRAYGYRPVKAPSIPALYRLGLVNFINPKSALRQPQHSHRLQLTETGRMILTLTKDRTE